MWQLYGRASFILHQDQIPQGFYTQELEQNRNGPKPEDYDLKVKIAQQFGLKL